MDTLKTLLTENTMMEDLETFEIPDFNPEMDEVEAELEEEEELN